MEIRIDKPTIEVGDMVKVLKHPMGYAKDLYGIVERIQCRPDIVIGVKGDVAVSNTIWTFHVNTARGKVSENQHFVALVQSKWHMYEAPITELEDWLLNTLYIEDTDLEFYEYHTELEHLQKLGYVHGVRFDGPRAWSLTIRGKYYINRGQ